MVSTKHIGRAALAASLLAFALVAVAPRALADPLDLRPVKVRDTRIKPTSAAAEDTAFTTTIDAGQAAAEGGGLAEHLARSVGVQVRRTGAHGDFSSVLIRGSSASQVAIFLDGIPLTTGRGALVDLSLFPLLNLSRIEVFRGYLPAEFGGEGMGGAINLIPGQAGKKPVTRLSLGLGSYDFTQLGFARSARHGKVRYAFTAALQLAKNNFEFFNANDTHYTFGDDDWPTRANNGFQLFSTLGWVRYQASRDLRITFLENFSFKTKGIPGPGSSQHEAVSLDALHQVFDVKIEKRRFLVPSLTGMLRATLQVARTKLDDPRQELMLFTGDQIDTTWSAGLLMRLSWAAHATQLISVIPEWRYESYAGDTSTGQQPNVSQLARASRYRAGIALRDRMVFWSDRVSLTPVVRFDAIYSDVTGTVLAKDELKNAFHWHVSPRLGAKVRALNWLSIRGNVGQYHRPPSLTELYGNRGTDEGNPELVPEKGLSGDVGVLVDLKKHKRLGALERLLVEAAFFGRESENLIQWVKVNLRKMKPENIAGAKILGGEFSLGLWLRLHAQLRARLTANYTFLHTEDTSGRPGFDGNQLPGRPKHEINARIDLAWRLGPWGVGLHYSVMHIAETFLDAANLWLPVPLRTLHSAGLVLRPWIPGFTLSATIQNFTNVRVEAQRVEPSTGHDRIPRALQDFAGYPLPGLRFFVTATWKT